MDLRVFYEVVVPLLEMGQAVLVMISTPVDSFNFYSALMELRDPVTKQRIFLVYSVDLVCERCQKKPHPERCRHRLRMLPPWKSAEKMDLVALIMKDQQTTLQRESMCVVLSTPDRSSRSSPCARAGRRSSRTPPGRSPASLASLR